MELALCKIESQRSEFAAHAVLQHCCWVGLLKQFFFFGFDFLSSSGLFRLSFISLFFLL
jgi:hypothetical protein